MAVHRDRRRWDERYGERPEPERLVVPEWLLRCLGRVGPPGRALDIACGDGHVAVELARRGWTVEAFDVSMVALRRARRLARRYGVTVHFFSADAQQYPLPRERYDLVTVFLFLDRQHLPQAIPEALRPGGALIYETFTAEALSWPGFSISSRSHLLEPNELLELYGRRLRVMEFRDLSDHVRPVQSLFARRSD